MSTVGSFSAFVVCATFGGWGFWMQTGHVQDLVSEPALTIPIIGQHGYTKTELEDVSAPQTFEVLPVYDEVHASEDDDFGSLEISEADAAVASSPPMQVLPVYDEVHASEDDGVGSLETSKADAAITSSPPMQVAPLTQREFSEMIDADSLETAQTNASITIAPAKFEEKAIYVDMIGKLVQFDNPLVLEEPQSVDFSVQNEAVEEKEVPWLMADRYDDLSAELEQSPVAVDAGTEIEQSPVAVDAGTEIGLDTTGGNPFMRFASATLAIGILIDLVLAVGCATAFKYVRSRRNRQVSTTTTEDVVAPSTTPGTPSTQVSSTSTYVMPSTTRPESVQLPASLHQDLAAPSGAETKTPECALPEAPTISTQEVIDKDLAAPSGAETKTLESALPEAPTIPAQEVIDEESLQAKIDMIVDKHAEHRKHCEQSFVQAHAQEAIAAAKERKARPSLGSAADLASPSPAKSLSNIEIQYYAHVAVAEAKERNTPAKSPQVRMDASPAQANWTTHEDAVAPRSLHSMFEDGAHATTEVPGSPLAELLFAEGAEAETELPAPPKDVVQAQAQEAIVAARDRQARKSLSHAQRVLSEKKEPTGPPKDEVQAQAQEAIVAARDRQGRKSLSHAQRVLSEKKEPAGPPKDEVQAQAQEAIAAAKDRHAKQSLAHAAEIACPSPAKSLSDTEIQSFAHRVLSEAKERNTPAKSPDMRMDASPSHANWEAFDDSIAPCSLKAMFDEGEAENVATRRESGEAESIAKQALEALASEITESTSLVANESPIGVAHIGPLTSQSLTLDHWDQLQQVVGVTHIEPALPVAPEQQEMLAQRTLEEEYEVTECELWRSEFPDANEVTESTSLVANESPIGVAHIEPLESLTLDHWSQLREAAGSGSSHTLPVAAEQPELVESASCVAKKPKELSSPEKVGTASFDVNRIPSPCRRRSHRSPIADKEDAANTSNQDAELDAAMDRMEAGAAPEDDTALAKVRQRRRQDASPTRASAAFRMLQNSATPTKPGTRRNLPRDATSREQEVASRQAAAYEAWGVSSPFKFQ